MHPVLQTHQNSNTAKESGSLPITNHLHHNKPLLYLEYLNSSNIKPSLYSGAQYSKYLLPDLMLITEVSR